MSNSPQKPSWSLQDNKRTAEERNAFKPTGKTAKKSTVLYVVSAVLVTFLASVSLTFASKKKLEVCLSAEYCFNSKDDILMYALYVFSTIAIIVFTIFIAYKFGKRFGTALKR